MKKDFINQAFIYKSEGEEEGEILFAFLIIAIFFSFASPVRSLTSK